MTTEYVYLVGVLDGCYKIGRSVDPDGRLATYAPLLPTPLVNMHRITTSEPNWLERTLHAAFQHRRIRGEWFRLTDEDVAAFRTMVAVRAESDLPESIQLLLVSHQPVPPDITPLPPPGAVTEPPVQKRSVPVARRRMSPSELVAAAEGVVRQVYNDETTIPNAGPLNEATPEKMLAVARRDPSVPMMTVRELFNLENEKDYYSITIKRDIDRGHKGWPMHAGDMLIVNRAKRPQLGDLVVHVVELEDGSGSFQITKLGRDHDGDWWLYPVCEIGMAHRLGESPDLSTLYNPGVVSSVMRLHVQIPQAMRL